MVLPGMILRCFFDRTYLYLLSQRLEGCGYDKTILTPPCISCTYPKSGYKVLNGLGLQGMAKQGKAKGS